MLRWRGGAQSCIYCDAVHAHINGGPGGGGSISDAQRKLQHRAAASGGGDSACRGTVLAEVAQRHALPVTSVLGLMTSDGDTLYALVHCGALSTKR